MKASFSDYINDSIRILILLDSVKHRKSVNMTENKIKLYDYYLKFPCTMLGEEFLEITARWNFDEYYAFFHWQPDLIRYRQSLNYLIGKGFAKKSLVKNEVVYEIEETGIEALEKIESAYKQNLMEIAASFLPKVIKLSAKRIEQHIREKADIYLRKQRV